MEKAAVAGVPARPRRAPRGCWYVLALAAWGACPSALAQDSSFHAPPRIDVSPSRPGGTSLAPVPGLSGFSAAPPGAGPRLQPRRAGLDIGLRWNHKQTPQRQPVDFNALQRMNAEDDAYTLTQLRDPVYGTRSEWNPAAARRSGLAMDRGFLGVQLESGARFTVRRKEGRPMFYYRNSF